MFDGYHCCHTISDIRTCEIGIFISQDSDLSGIRVHNCGKCSLETCKMGSTFRIINVVAEAQYIFSEIIGILKSHFHLNTFGFSLQIYRIM